ncbi:hypothetical protein [Entomohabitans teleogrylli]|uniref:hypothetical protein n=1 Tax=Entomohabitans teleogrylli TaxID=1384589 RepID=UPI00073DA993|nr:hypothetical protein [Entomohabitans teleogrylli]
MLKAKLFFISLLTGSALVLSACDNANSENKAPVEGASQPAATSILGGSATIVLPQGYVKMPKELLEAKYPAAQRPQEAWYVESEGGKVSIAFSATSSAISDAQVEKFADMMKQQLSSFSPSLSQVTVNGRKMSRIEMLTPAADGKIYNLMQLSSRDGKLLISTFNVTEDLQVKYAKAGEEALSTLKY